VTGSPDGEYLYVSGFDLYVIRPDGTGRASVDLRGVSGALHPDWIAWIDSMSWDPSGNSSLRLCDEAVCDVSEYAEPGVVLGPPVAPVPDDDDAGVGRDIDVLTEVT
jgi:hypothetical protein